MIILSHGGTSNTDVNLQRPGLQTTAHNNILSFEADTWDFAFSYFL